MNNFNKLIANKLWELNETTMAPVKPQTTPSVAPSTRPVPSRPNPFKRPGQTPFVKPKPKAQEGDNVASFLAKRINSKLKKYT